VDGQVESRLRAVAELIHLAVGRPKEAG